MWLRNFISVATHSYRFDHVFIWGYLRVWVWMMQQVLFAQIQWPNTLTCDSSMGVGSTALIWDEINSKQILNLPHFYSELEFILNFAQLDSRTRMQWLEFIGLFMFGFLNAGRLSVLCRLNVLSFNKRMNGVSSDVSSIAILSGFDVVNASVEIHLATKFTASNNCMVSEVSGNAFELLNIFDILQSRRVRGMFA